MNYIQEQAKRNTTIYLKMTLAQRLGTINLQDMASIYRR